MKNSIVKAQDADFYTQKLWAFGNSMKGCDYVATLGIMKFIVRDSEEPFTIDLLKELFVNNSEVVVDGFLTQVSFEAVQEAVAHGLAFKGNSYEEDGRAFLTSRELIFWGIVKQVLGDMPPGQCFEHRKPGGRGCLFGENWVMWGFCYILIKDNVGALLSCGAWD